MFKVTYSSLGECWVVRFRWWDWLVENWVLNIAAKVSKQPIDNGESRMNHLRAPLQRSGENLACDCVFNCVQTHMRNIDVNVFVWVCGFVILVYGQSFLARGKLSLHYIVDKMVSMCSSNCSHGVGQSV